jgi:anti-sigma B factor antagonist
MAAQADLRRSEQLGLSHWISQAGEAVVRLGGDLDIVSAEAAVAYVMGVMDRHGGPVTADLSALAFCDACGLAALVRMADYAELAGCPFRLASPKPPLVKILRITGLHHRFLAVDAGRDAWPGLPDPRFNAPRLPRDIA